MKKTPMVIRDMQDHYFNAGVHTGEQLAADCFAMAAFDCGVSRKTIREMTQKAIEYTNAYGNCLNTKVDPEADVYQEKMDSKLKPIYEELFVPFSERYEYIKKCKY